MLPRTILCLHASERKGSHAIFTHSQQIYPRSQVELVCISADVGHSIVGRQQVLACVSSLTFSSDFHRYNKLEDINWKLAYGWQISKPSLNRHASKSPLDCAGVTNPKPKNLILENKLTGACSLTNSLILNQGAFQAF
jgi:hypothetical protein